MRFPFFLSDLDFDKRINALQFIISAAFIVTFFISPQLWLDERLIPTAPFISGYVLIPFFNYLVIAGLLIAVVLSPITRSGWMELLAALTLAILIFFDQHRFQQETYLFLLWWLGIGLHKRYLIHPMAILPTLQLTVLAVYLVGGLMKVNPWFGTNVYSWVISPLNEAPLGYYISKGWQLAPLAEISLGVLLMFPGTRFIGCCLSVAFHLMMLYLFGPFGNNYHQLMWPMQFILPVVVFLLFSEEDFRNPFVYIRTCAAPRVVALVLFVFPVFHLFGKYDAVPSFASYDGRHYLGYVAVEAYVVPELPEFIRKKVSKVEDHDKWLVPIDNWVSEELAVPCYHEKRVYMRYKRLLEPYAKHPGDVFAVMMQEGEVKIIQED